MQSTTARIGLLAALVAVAVVLFIVLSGDDDNDSGTTTAQTTTEAGGQPAGGPPVITVRDGKPVGGVQDLTFSKGDRVEFVVQLDQPAEEVHVHGYDIKKDLEPGKTETMSFKASITGIFEVGFEGSGEQIAELRVDPK
jgi:hypothetical protein